MKKHQRKKLSEDEKLANEVLKLLKKETLGRIEGKVKATDCGVHVTGFIWSGALRALTEQYEVYQHTDGGLHVLYKPEVDDQGKILPKKKGW